MRWNLTVILCILSLQTVFAQDKIFQSNGNVIDAKIKMIKGSEIIYWHWNDMRGPLYSLSLNEVDKIRYENGQEEVFNGNNNNRVPSEGMGYGRYMHPMPNLGKDIVSVSPIFTTENGVGAAVSYEHVLDKAGIVSYILPVGVTYNPDTHDESVKGKHQDMMYYFTPGIKFYPTGDKGSLKYAVGPALALGVGEKTTGGDYAYTWNGTQYISYYQPYNTQTKVMLGIVVNNSLNINPSPHMYIGLDFGFGFTYINQLNGSNFGVSGIVQSGFKLGYRF